MPVGPEFSFARRDVLQTEGRPRGIHLATKIIESGGPVSRRTLGILAGMFGSAVGAWWWARIRNAQQSTRQMTPARDHGTVIFDNTPTAVEGGVL